LLVVERRMRSKERQPKTILALHSPMTAACVATQPAKHSHDMPPKLRLILLRNGSAQSE
jgi:hypothetical protein